MSNKYLRQAEKFLSSCGAKLTIEYLATKPYFLGDNDSRDVYVFTLSTPKGRYASNFVNSVYNSYRGIKPTVYDVLSRLNGYPPAESFSGWCDDMGYSKESISALKVYSAVTDEYTGLKAIFSSKQLEQLRDIQ